MNKVFTPVKEGHDPKNRIVFVTQTETGFNVTKPRTGFSSRSWESADHPELLQCFSRQVGCSHNQASYHPGERVTASDSNGSSDKKKKPAGKKKVKSA